MPKRRHGSGSARLTRRHEAWVLAVAALLFASGVAWLLLRAGARGLDEGGEGRAALLAGCLRVHGAATMIFLVVIGTLLPLHMNRAWHQRRHRVTGVLVATAVALLVATGYALYYAGDEDLRPWISVAHWAVGLAGLPALGWHVVQGKRRAARRAAARPARPLVHGSPHPVREGGGMEN
ncbi:MAG TPA: hypothetical protein VMU33_20710 [Burkholderiaceae bacterium]|nr:hypothetical protein [Burkholderiaceae bacterium]